MIEQDVHKFLTVTPISEKTKILYEYCLRTYFNWAYEYFDEPQLLEQADIIRFLSSNAEWSNSTKRNMLAAIRTFYRWKWGDEHPVTKTRIRKVEPGPQRTLEEDEVTQIMASIDTSTPKGVRDLAMIALLVDTGMRSSELCSLEVKALMMRKRRLSIFTKGGRWQEKVFSEYTQSLLENWLSIRDKYADKKTKTVFVSIGGKKPGSRMTISGIRQICLELAERTGVEPFSTHALRRTFATLAIQNGAPSRLVQVAGGWKSITMVERYTQRLRPDAMSRYSPINHVMGIREVKE